MTTKRIVYTRPDGGISIAYPAPGARLVKSILDFNPSDAIVVCQTQRQAVLPSLGAEVNSIRLEFDPPVRLEQVGRLTMDNAEEYAAWLATLEIEYAETEDEFVTRLMRTVIPADALNPTIVEASAIPTDRTYREAWVLSGRECSVDIVKARAVHRDLLRRARTPMLAALDIDYQRADENDDSTRKKEIVAQKNLLRDITADTAIDAAKTPDALKAAWPAALV